jgi:hypothetical protein
MKRPQTRVSRSRRGGLGAGLALALLITTGLAPSPAAAQAEEIDDGVAPPVERHTITLDSGIEIIESNLPWKLVRDDETDELRLYVGPGVEAAVMLGTVVQEWGGPTAAQDTAPSPEARASSNWYCNPVSQDPRRTGGYMWAWHRSSTSASWFPCGYSEF